MMAPLGAGQLDVAGGGINPGLFNSLARGFPIKIVAAKGREEPGHSGDTSNIWLG